MKRLLALTLLLVSLAGCSTATPAPSGGQPSAPTATLLPSFTAVPVPPKTSTIMTFPASAFSVEIVGVGEHGAMYELKYAGGIGSLDGISVQLDAEQNGEKRDSSQRFEIVDGRYLAEMTDALYHLGDVDVVLRIDPDDSTYAPIELKTKLSQWYPFIGPLLAQSVFADDELAVVPTHGHEQGKSSEWYATDLCSVWCGPSGNYESHGTQVYMPFSIEVLWISATSDIGHNIVLLHPYTGYVFLLSHQIPSEQLLQDLGNPALPYFAKSATAKVIPYDPTRPISSWAKPTTTMIPHLHIEGQVFIPGDHDLWQEVYVMDGSKRYGNCLPQEFGPCLPNIYNISLDRYLIDGWLNPDL